MVSPTDSSEQHTSRNHSTTSSQDAAIASPEPGADLTANAKSSDDERSLAPDIPPENSDPVFAEPGAGDETEGGVASSKDSGDRDDEEKPTVLYVRLHDLLHSVEDGEAISDENVEKKIREILSRYGGKQRAHDAVYCNTHPTELDVAVGLNSHEALKFLLDQGAKVPAPEPALQRPPLSVACSFGNEAMVRLLLDNGAYIDAKDANHISAIDYVCFRGKESMADLLIQLGVNTQVVDGQDWTPLHSAVYYGSVHIVKSLLGANSANIDARNGYGVTALGLAIMNSHGELIKVLLGAGADPNAVTGDKGVTPLMEAVSQSETGIAEALLSAKHPVEIDKRGPQQRTALHIAAKRGMSNMVSLLLEKGADALAEDSDGCMPLHLASTEGHVDVLNRLLPKLGKKQIERTDNNGHTAIMKACQAGSEDVMMTLLNNFDETYFGGKELVERDALRWASENQGRHDLAALLLSKGPQPNEDLKQKGKEWSAIEWAAYRKNAPVLWLLLVNSYPDEKTKRCQTAAKDIATKSTYQQTQKPMSSQPPGKSSKYAYEQVDGENAAPDAKSKDSDLQDIIKDILSDPPNMYYRGSKPLEYPSHRGINSELLDNYDATISFFSSSQTASGMLERFRSVKDVIYDRGPIEIYKSSIKGLQTLRKRVEEQCGKEGLDAYGIPVQAMDDKQEIDFIWVHLPATNMRWMNDLLQRIMKEENCSTSDYERIRAFIQKSWVQVPDRTTASRIMRPLCSRKDEEKCDHCSNIEDKPSGETGPVAQDGNEDSTKAATSQTPPEGKVDDDSPKVKKQGPAGKGGVGFDNSKDSLSKISVENTVSQCYGCSAVEAIYMPYFTFSTQHQDDREKEVSQLEPSEQDKSPKKLSEAKDEYRELISAYEKVDGIVHGSATLDESYYHFDSNDSNGGLSSTECLKRNKSQVVTKRLEDNDNFAETDKSIWELVRVNQVWAWTIGKKWLLTASSHPIDGSKEGLVQDILHEVKSQEDFGGAQFQPRCTKDMCDFIVDYCIGAYDRKRNAKGSDERSIRQLFLDSINIIGIQEAELSSNNKKRREADQVVSGQGFTSSIDHAEALSTQIKDIRDELAILRSVAKYQENVQKELFDGRKKTSNMSSTYVLDDLGEMDEVSKRVQAAVNMTLSLQQNEMTVTQNKTLLVFSVVTILFSPLSFLTSLFALDVASFLKAPAWSIGVISGLSFALFVPLVTVAVGTKKMLRLIKDVPRKTAVAVKEWAYSSSRGALGHGAGKTKAGQPGHAKLRGDLWKIVSPQLWHHPRAGDVEKGEGADSVTGIDAPSSSCTLYSLFRERGRKQRPVIGEEE